ncbi:hypothetical protein BC792_11464 [Sphingobacterium allocomposti]|jgi:protein CpxP|uniref:LTXXQ motif family protein n=1 Tax=Sphingobacterium allocomposti TaxID=415956 RepID=A0A5S5DAR9_9SPHI|nr:hypothetical protein [Sphingobacterium composti Yoo et al. 2007 non Ten et al. 2007]TYP93163.1 hypothetical protein BC792_11464 [Sphingobacterium composti Yoo et al. 2007 non Ten et al. 2007]HLS94467.1 hypothetical protein [Sphingobacterium sp.]
MKKTLFLAVLLGGFSLTTMAQESKVQDSDAKKERRHVRHERKIAERSPEEIAKLKTDRLDETLKFTDAQRQEVYAIQLDQAKRQVAHRDEMRKLHSEWRKEAKGSREKLHEVLTPEQQQLMKEKFADNKKVKGMRKRGMFKGERPTGNQKNIEEKTQG